MLVSRKQEWELEVLEPQRKSHTSPSSHQPKLNVALRRKCFLLATVIAVMMGALTVQSVLVVHSGYQLVEIKKNLSQVDRDNEALKLQVSRLKTPDRIQKIATEQLGLVMPQTVLHSTVSGN